MSQLSDESRRTAMTLMNLTLRKRNAMWDLQKDGGVQSGVLEGGDEETTSTP